MRSNDRNPSQRKTEKVTLKTNPFFSQEHTAMTLTKDHLIESIRDSVGLSKSVSTRIVEFVLETMKNSLSTGKDVLISGFGKLSVKTKAPRRGRNPATGEDLTLGARRIVMFRGHRF